MTTGKSSFLLPPFGKTIQKSPSDLSGALSHVDRAINVLTRRLRRWLSSELQLTENPRSWIGQFKDEINLRTSSLPTLARTHTVSEIITQLPNLIRLHDALSWADTLGRAYSVELCHPTQSHSDDWNADLVLKDTNTRTCLCFEITDSKSPTNNEKLAHTFRKFRDVRRAKPKHAISFFMVAPISWEGSLRKRKFVMATYTQGSSAIGELDVR